MEKKLTARAARKTMTLDELARFVQQAMRDGAAGDATPKVRVLFGGGIKTIDVHVADAKTVSS